MPRTKAPRAMKRDKKSMNANEKCSVTPALTAQVKDVELQYQGRLDAFAKKKCHLISAIRLAFDMALMKLSPSENFLLSYGEEEVNNENSCLINSPFDDTVSTSVVSPEFHSVTNSVSQSEVSAGESRRSRSLSRNLPMKTPAPRSNSANEPKTTSRVLRSSTGRDMCAMPPPSTLGRFCTPASHMVPDGSRYNAITPKVVPNSSVSVLRRPRGGEMAFAMTGSPLMVASNNIGDEVCNVNLPLGDGRVLSILPTAIRPRDLPHMNKDAIEQLVQLRKNLDLILSGERGPENQY